MANKVNVFNNLAVTHPKLAKEYMPPPKNKLPADKVHAGTNKKLYWKCPKKKCGHEWSARGQDRVKGKGCPACANRVVTEKNNLAVTHRKLAKEYMPPPWNKLPANQVIAGSYKSFLWKCSKKKCGHEWSAKGKNRVSGTGCPACANQVVTEKNNLAVTHRKLAKEYMPPPWNKLPANQVVAGSDEIFLWKCSKKMCGHEWPARGSKRAKGAGCPACAKQVVTEKNNLAVTHRKLAKEYMPPPWNKLPANQVMAGSNKIFLWKCSKSKCGYKWKAKGGNRVRRGSGCPACANQVVTEKNNLAVTHRKLAKEYMPPPWNKLPANQVIAGSQNMFLWKCSKKKCGHEWKSTGGNRTNGRGCPMCNVWGIPGVRKDLLKQGVGCRFRSTWEANIARLLIRNGQSIIYEKKHFVLNQKRYTPDFELLSPIDFIPGSKAGDFLEVKGRVFKTVAQTGIIDQINKAGLYRVHLIDDLLYFQVESTFSHLVPLWERPGFNLRTHPEIFNPSHND